MTRIHTDTLDCMLDCFSVVAIAEAYAELAARMAAEDAPLADELRELNIALGALGDSLARRIMAEKRR